MLQSDFEFIEEFSICTQNLAHFGAHKRGLSALVSAIFLSQRDRDDENPPHLGPPEMKIAPLLILKAP